MGDGWTIRTNGSRRHSDWQYFRNGNEWKYFNHFRDQANRDYKRRIQADQARARGQEATDHPERIAAEQRRAEAAEAERLQAEQAAQEAERQTQATTEIPEPDGKTPSLDQARELDNAQRTAANLGLPVIFTDSDNPIHTQGAADNSAEATRRGSNAYVFFPEGGGEPRIVINVDRCDDWHDVYLKTLHEGSAHYGLRQMFGKDYDTFLDNVYDAATDELRAGIDRFLNYNPQYKRDSNGQPLKDEEGRDIRDNLADRRQAVDEYLAHLAEKRPQDLTQPERTLWAKIKEWFISLLRQKGFNIKRLTDEDLIDLLRESHRRLLTEQSQRMAEQGEAPTDRTQVLRTSEPGAPESPAEAPTSPDGGTDRLSKAEDYTFSEFRAERGGRFYQNKSGEIDLVDISDDVFNKMGIPKMPFRITDGMAYHVFTRHQKELGLENEADAVRYVVDLMNSFDHVRKGDEENTFIFSIENGRDKNAHRSITLVIPDSKNKYLGIKTAGLVRLSNIEKRPVLWEKSEPSTTGAAPANVTATQPNEDGRTGGNASNQSTDLSSKVTQNSDNDQTNPEKNIGDGEKTSYSLPVTDDERQAREHDREIETRLTPETLIKAGKDAEMSAEDLGRPYADAGVNGSRVTSYGRFDDRGRREGLHLDFNEEGRILFYGTYRDGHPVGTHYLYYDYDKLFPTIGNVKYNVYNIVKESDYKPGQVKDELHYNDAGKFDGENRSYTSDGKLISRDIWKDGEHLAEWYAPNYLRNVADSGGYIYDNITPADARRMLRAQKRNGSKLLVPREKENAGEVYVPETEESNTRFSLADQMLKPEVSFDEWREKEEGGTRFSFSEETLDEIKNEKAQIKESANKYSSWLKAPNNAETKLNEQQWTEVRTTPFKKWFGNWDISERVKIIENLVPVKEILLAKGETFESTYKKIGSAINKQDNIKVIFFNSAYNKIAKAGGLSERSTPMLKKCFEESVYAYSEPDKLGGTMRPDGTIHKAHPNVEEFRNYVGKIMINGLPHYVRFTVQVQKGNTGLHSYFVTDIDVYKNTANSLSVPNLLGPRVTASGVVDTKLQQFFQTAKQSAKESSKIVDENGEPLVVYHQTDADFTVFDPRHPGAGTNDHHLPFGIFLKPTKDDIGMKGKRQMPLFANIKNPLVVADRNSLTQYLRENVKGYSELLTRYNNIDKEYKAKFDEASERSRTKYTELWHQWKDGKISEDEYQRGIDDREEEAILKEWKEAGNKLSAEMKKLVDGHFRSSDYDGIILENDEGSFGRSTKTILAFDENQVKSATDNIGTFSPTNGDIRFSRDFTPEETPLSEYNPLAHVEENRRRIAEREEGDRPIDWSDPYEAFRRPRTARLELESMPDTELLDRMRTADGYVDDWNFFSDEYDRRHMGQYTSLTDHYRSVLEDAGTSLDDAYAMLRAASQHFHYGGHARPERTELLAQRDVLQDYIDRKEAEQAAAEHGTDRYSLPEDQQRTAEIFSAAKERFGKTRDIREAGYILPDGTMLDFSGRHEMAKGSDTSFLNGQRHADHRQISDIAYDFDENETGVKTTMDDFIRRGAIRIDDNAGAINLINKPTKEQQAVLRRLIARNNGDVYVDFGDGDNTDHYAEYEGAKPTRILADIDRYFDEGIKPEGVTRYSKPMEDPQKKSDAAKHVEERLAELNRLEEKEQSLKSNPVGNSADLNSDENYSPGMPGAQSAAPSPAKLNKKIQNAKDLAEKMPDFIKTTEDGKGVTAENFAKTLMKSIGLSEHLNQQSEYIHASTDGENTYTLRVSDHEGNARNIIINGVKTQKGYSIVLKTAKSPDKKFKPNSWAEVEEYVYENPDTERLTNIAKSIFNLLDTGEYVDLADADGKAVSPTTVTEAGTTLHSLPGGNTNNPASTGVSRGIDLSSWDPLASVRQHVTDSRQARLDADQAWTDHRARREQAIASHTAVKNDPNLTPAQKNRLQNDMIRRVADVRALVSKVREGDRESVKAVTQTVLDLADAVGDGLTRGAVKKLMHAVENATTRRDVKTEVDKAVDVILTQVTREAQQQTQKLLHTKATKLDPNNIRVAGQMDEHGQRSLKQLNELLSPEGQSTDLDQLEAQLQSDTQSSRQVTAGNAADKLLGLKLARVHRDTVVPQRPAPRGPQADFRHRLRLRRERDGCEDHDGRLHPTGRHPHRRQRGRHQPH